MPSYYFDTSALVKLYTTEEGTSGVIDLVRDLTRHQIAILDIALLEFRSAIRRKQRDREISTLDTNFILTQMEEHAASLFYVHSLTPVVTQEAARLIDLYPLKAYDAVQLAGCLIARNVMPAPLTFVCADFRLCGAADAEGVVVFNPMEGS
jgi:predicted nucleic acid-binding protein